MVQKGVSSRSTVSILVIVDEHLTLFVIVQDILSGLYDSVSLNASSGSGKDRTHFRFVGNDTLLTQLVDKPYERQAVLLQSFTNSIKFLHVRSLLSVLNLVNNS
nr:MAG TPA: hypothetical protein [Caudoviricetes sp.]